MSQKTPSNQPDKSVTESVPKYFIDKPDGSLGYDLGPGGKTEYCRVIAKATGNSKYLC